MNNHYPMWKNAILVLLVIIGLIYSVPNLYSEDPVLQISATPPANVEQAIQHVQKILQTSHLVTKSVKLDNDHIQIRFASTDTQLLAYELLRKDLGSAYTVALNLATSTPAWLSSIGASPMKQGLDLRGGVHLLLEIDIDSVINRRYEGLVKNIGHELRTNNVRYSGIHYVVNKGIDLRFRNAKLRDEALDDLTDKFRGLIFTKQEQNFGLILSLSEHEITEIQQNTIEQTMGILRNRVNELGVGEAVVQQQGSMRVAVDLPGIQDAARAKQILGGTATLYFYMVDSENDPVQAQQSGVVPLNSKLYIHDGAPMLLKRQVVLSGDSITSALSSMDDQSALPAVQIQLGGGGEELFSQITRENIGQRMAIVFVETKTMTHVIDGKEKKFTHRTERIISAPVIQSALGHNFQITGLSDIQEASNLALLLRAGSLPAAIYPVEERTVGPTLGRENIERGMISLAVGMGLILVLMLVYYRMFGLIANISLLLNLIFLCALLSIIGATLTLAGIAGIVLTVGMAVDANVLIYERIREELRNGLSSQSAIYAGYERAFATILDANITTLIVAIVLFAVGAGPVRGFAVTLSLGLLTSMLTGVTFTRAIVNVLYGRSKNKKLPIGI